MGCCGAAVRPGRGRRLCGVRHTQVARGKGSQPFAYDCAGSPSERLASGRYANASSAMQREHARPLPLTGGMACRPKGFMNTAASCTKQARAHCMCTARALHTLGARCTHTAWALHGHFMGTAWALHGHCIYCMGTAWALYEHRTHAWNVSRAERL